MPSLLIKDCTILTMDYNKELVKKGFIEIQDGLITKVGKMEDFVGGKFDEVVEASGKLVIPGLISGHTHASLSLIRGLGYGLKLDKLVANLLWPYEKALKPEDSYYASLLACVEMIKAGITCFADMHFNMEEVAKAVRDSGMRASLSVAMMDAEGSPLTMDESVRQNEELVRKWDGKAEGRISCMFGPCTVRVASEDLFIKAKELADRYGVGLHIHLSEVKDDVNYTIKKYGLRPVNYLDRIGLLNNKVVAAHAIHLNDEEINILAKRKVNVIHNPSSNLNTYAGMFKWKEIVKKGINVGIGCDTTVCCGTFDMFNEIRTAINMQRMFNPRHPSNMSSLDLLKSSTLNNAKALNLQDKVGIIKEGMKADLIMIDLKQPHIKPLFYTPEHIANSVVYCISGRDVNTVIVDGKIIMKDRRILTLDEKYVLEMATRTILRIIERGEVGFLSKIKDFQVS